MYKRQGLRIPECSLTLNDLFELWRKNKVGLKEHTFANYVYMYNRFVRDEIGTVSYTHLDVYKRQPVYVAIFPSIVMAYFMETKGRFVVI